VSRGLKAGKSLFPDNLHLRERSIDNRQAALVDINQYGRVVFQV